MDTLTIIKKVVAKPELVNPTHTKRLLCLIEGEDKSLEYRKLELMENNLIWYVTAGSILKFKYHVNIRGCGIAYYSDEQVERYIGDIPDFAISRAELALRLGIRYITLHSMNPLPVERVHIDPIMVGWIQAPEIHTDISGRFFSYQEKNQGVILAIWDNEKELEL